MPSSGPALTRIGAMRAYGLVEGAGDDLRISNDAVTALSGQSGKLPLTPPTLAETPADRLPAGEREWLRGPLSRDTSYRLIVAGDLGPKEIGKLIKLLKAQQAVLSDEDGDEGDEAAN